MAYRNESTEVQSLINLYRANPNMFNDSQLDILQDKAAQYGINFKPIADTTSLTSLAKNFTGGFIRGMIPFVPPDEQPRTTYDAIAQSLGHLAGFAPSILAVPLGGVTKGLKAIGAIDKTRKGFVGQKAVGVLDKWPFPMMGSRMAKKYVGKGISKLELDTLDSMKAGGVGRAIAEESIGLGTASLISNIWAGPDDYMNTFIGGALAGGVFGGIGNWRAIGNRLGVAKSQGQRTRTEDALKATVGSAFMGLPSTLRGEPIEMQLYEYLLGGFFGYKTRPAAEAEGGRFVMEMDATRPESIFKPEINPGFADLHPNAKAYVHKQSTAQAEKWLNNNIDGDVNQMIKQRLQYEDNPTKPGLYEREMRNLAHEEYTRRRQEFVTQKHNENPDTDNGMDYMDPVETVPTSVQKVAEDIYSTIGKTGKLTSSEQIARDLNRKISSFILDRDMSVKNSPDPDAFVESVKNDALYAKWINNPKKQKELYKLFAQRNKQQYDTQVYNLDDNTISTVSSGTKADLKFVGINQYNSPIVDIFGAGRGFNFLSYVSKVQGKRVVYEDIFKYDPFKNKFNIGDNISNIMTELAKNGQYIYAGVKDKNMLLTARFNDNGMKINELAEYASKEKAQLLDYFKKSEAEFINNVYAGNNPKAAKKIHEKQFVSNILHELINHGYTQNGRADLSRLPKILGENYFKDAIDFNKRMQGYVEASGMPMHPNTFRKSIGGNELRFMVLKDRDFNPDKTEGTSETDGGLFFRPAVFKDIVRVMGFDNKTQDNIKPVVMGRLSSPVQKGLVFIKSGGKNAAGQEAINKIIKDNNLDFVVFDSANKIKGETRPTTFRYENGQYILEGMPEVHKVGIRSLRINPSTYEDVPGGIKGVNLPRQFFITANEHQSPNTLRSFIDHYYTNLEGTTKARGLVEEFKQTGDIKPIQEYLEASRSNIDKMPLSFVIKQLGKNTEDGNVFRRALQKIDAESDKLIESFEMDTNKQFSFFHNSTTNLSRLAGGKYAPNTFFEKLRGDYFNAIRKYTVKRVTTPFWPYGGKGWLNPVTRDVFVDADMINNRPIKQGEVLLDAAHQKMPVKINLEPAQIAALNKFKRGINKDGETTLGHLWTLWKINKGKLGTPEQVNNFKNLPKETIQKLDEALDLLLIRIPADSLSGTRSVKFKGFTKHKGAGVTTHRTEDRYLGGADKDADSAFIIQNGSRQHIAEIRKVANERDTWNESQIMADFSTKKDLPTYSKFSPVDRIRAYATGRKGADQRGQVIAMRDAIFELYARAKANNGILELDNGVVLKLKEGGIDKFIKNVYGSINVNNDSTKYYNIKSITKIREKMYNDLFTIEKNGTLIPPGKIGKNEALSSVGSFFSRFKTNSYAIRDKKGMEKYEDLIKLSEEYEGQDFHGAAGRQFKHASELGIFKDARNISEAKDFNLGLRKSLKELTPDPKEQKFLKEFLGVTEIPIKNLQDVWSKLSPGGRSNFELYDDISINLGKSAAYELLTEKALGVYRGFSESKQNNIPDIKKALVRTYNKARNRANQLYQAEKNLENNKVFKMEDFNEAVREDKAKLLKFAKSNKLDAPAVASLLKFYDIALMNPLKIVEAKGRISAKHRLQNGIFGSEEVYNSSKKDFMDKMQEIHDRIPGRQMELFPEEVVKPISTDSRQLVYNMDKAVSNTIKIGKSVKGKKFKHDDLDILATKDSDYADIRLLRENLKKFPQIDSLNDFFIDFTSKKGGGDGRDLSLATIQDIRAMNEFFKYGETGAKGRFKWVNWLIDPRTISDKELQPTIRKYESYITNYRSITGAKKAPVVKYMTPLGATRRFLRQSLRFQNAALDKIKNENRALFDYDKYGLSKNDKQHLFNHISKLRNPQQEDLSPADMKFLTKKFKGKTGSELVKEYNDKFTKFVEDAGKIIYTYDKKGKRIDFSKVIDIENPKYGKLNDYIKFGKDGKFDQRLFIDKVLRPITTGKEPPMVGIESVLRFQYESIMEGKLKAKGKDTLAGREEYRKKNKFSDYAFGFINPSEYFPRTNYGWNEKAKKLMNQSIEKLVGEGKGNYENLFLFTENTMSNSARVEDNYLNMTYEFADKSYKDVGFKSKPKNLLQRGEEFIDGYDKRPEVVDRYKEQLIRSYYSNLMAIYGNREIQRFKKTTDLDKGLTDKQIKALEKAGYKNNTDVWSDFLYIYLKNSLGHPSLLTDRIQKSMHKGDPLKLKRNPYYLTTDYAITNALEKMYKNDKINKLPFMRNAPEDPKLRRDYFVRRIHELGAMEAKYNLLTLLANTGSMMTNLYGGGVTTIGSASFKHFKDAQRNSVVVDRLLKDASGNFVLKLKNGKPVKTRKQLIEYLNEAGVIDNYIANELEYNEGLATGISKLGKDAKNFIRDLKASIKRGDRDETIMQLAERYGIKDVMLKSGGFFMQVSERKNRIDAFIAHALKSQERLGPHGNQTNLSDPYLFDAGLKGIEATQFLYHNAFRPAFMTTALGKVLTRFKLFAFQSVRTRKEFYKQAKDYGFKEGTPEYQKFKDLYLTDLFAYAMAGAFMYSVFDTALPPPWDWMQDTSDLLFGDKKERDRAFYGTLPRPIAPLQVALPPIARFPQTFVELIQGDWEKFSDYTIHTMYPFGRIMYSFKKTAERPERFFHNFFRIPTDKIGYRIRREDLRESRAERIKEYFDE